MNNGFKMQFEKKRQIAVIGNEIGHDLFKDHLKQFRI